MDPHTSLAPALAGPVLLAADGEAPTDATARAALSAAQRLDVAVDVVSVLEPLPLHLVPAGVSMMPPRFDATRLEARERAVVARVAPVLGTRDQWRLDIEFGAVGRAIGDAARRRGAALVVVGARTHRDAGRPRGDDVALQVVRHGGVPVLAVAPNSGAPIRRAVVGVDFGAASTRAAMAALQLLEPARDGGTLVLVHVRAPYESAYLTIDGLMAAYETHVEQCFARLRGLLRPYTPHGITIETRAGAGTPSETLLETAQEVSAQLVAVGSHGQAWAERLFVGEVASATLRHAQLTVLVTPPPSGIDRVRLELGVEGRIELVRREEWSAALDAFTRRNAGRRARLDFDATAESTHAAQAVGYRLVGATYDPHDERVELMLGDDPSRARRLTHTIGGVKAVEIVAEDDGRVDRVLTIADATGATTLRFIDG